MELEGVLLGLFGPHAQQKPPDSSIWTRIFSSKGISWETFEQESILRLALWTNACALRNVAHLLTATSKLIEEVTKRKDAVQFDEATQALLLCSCFLALIIEGDKDRVGTFKFLLSVLDFSADVEQCKAGEEVLSSLLKLQVQVGKLSIYLRTRCKSLRDKYIILRQTHLWLALIGCVRGNASPFLQALFEEEESCASVCLLLLQHQLVEEDEEEARAAEGYAESVYTIRQLTILVASRQPEPLGTLLLLLCRAKESCSAPTFIETFSSLLEGSKQNADVFSRIVHQILNRWETEDATVVLLFFLRFVRGFVLFCAGKNYLGQIVSVLTSGVAKTSSRGMDQSLLAQCFCISTLLLCEDRATVALLHRIEAPHGAWIWKPAIGKTNCAWVLACTAMRIVWKYGCSKSIDACSVAYACGVIANVGATAQEVTKGPSRLLLDVCFSLHRRLHLSMEKAEERDRCILEESLLMLLETIITSLKRCKSGAVPLLYDLVQRQQEFINLLSTVDAVIHSRSCKGALGERRWTEKWTILNAELKKQMLFWVSVVENAQADQKDIANELSLLIEMSVNDHFKCLGADSIPYVFEEDESFVSYFLPVLWRIVSGCDKNGPWHVIEKHFVN